MRPFRLREDVVVNLDQVGAWEFIVENQIATLSVSVGPRLIYLIGDEATDAFGRLEALLHDDIPTTLDGMGDVSAIPTPESDLADRMDDLEDRFSAFEAATKTALLNLGEQCAELRKHASHLDRRTIGSQVLGATYRG